MRKITITQIILIFGLILYLLHFTERNPSSPYERPIISDAKGYYAYLPAIFIYQDFSYDFVAEVDAKYYAVGQDKHIFIEQNGHRVNKTFPGVALLYLPFFLIAHFLAFLLGFPPDGYSDIYQYLFDFGQFFYATLGLILLSKILHKFDFSRKTILFAVFSLSLGTNLWYYTVYDQSLTHSYNFFLVNALVFYVLKLKEDINTRNYVISFGILALLLIIRPTGILSLFVLTFFFPDRKFISSLIAGLKNSKRVALILLVMGVIFFIPLLLWKVQSGDWVVYSYGEEGFDFLNPQVFDFLFSYAKGWWLYSPLTLFAIVFGLIVLFQQKAIGKLRAIFLFLFLLSSIYIFSSWWCWWYGFSFGQRPMVDFYILIGFLIALVHQKWTKTIRQQLLLGGIMSIFIFFNIFQSYQHHHGFFQWSKPNAEIYWDNFLRFKKQSKVYTEEHWTLLSTQTFDFENDQPSYQGERVDGEKASSGQKVIYVDKGSPYSCSVNAIRENDIQSDFTVISFQVYAFTDLSETDLVVEYRGEQSTYRSFNFNEFTAKDEWTLIQLNYNELSSSDTLVVYFWNKDSSQKAYFDDLRVEFYRN